MEDPSSKQLAWSPDLGNVRKKLIEEGQPEAMEAYRKECAKIAREYVRESWNAEQREHVLKFLNKNKLKFGNWILEEEVRKDKLGET